MSPANFFGSLKNWIISFLITSDDLKAIPDLSICEIIFWKILSV